MSGGIVWELARRLLSGVSRDGKQDRYSSHGRLSGRTLDHKQRWLDVCYGVKMILIDRRRMHYGGDFMNELPENTAIVIFSGAPNALIQVNIASENYS